jgi:glycosyltransferase involved in cell wall biosynthesis
MAGRQWARERYLPFVVTPFAHFGTGKDRVARNSTMDHQLQLLREAAGIFALTSVEQEGLRQYSVNSERVAVVGSGLDPLPETADFILLQQQYHLSRPFVIFIGRNSYEKGAIHAAQAVLAMRQQGSPIALVLVGQMTAEFERFYGRLTEREKGIIRPLGILSEPDKHTLLSQAELLLLPSRTDSFGIVLLEAWAHNKAVIGARAGGIPGVVDDGQNGLLVPFGDVLALAQAIHRLLHTPDLKQAMGQQGQTKITAEYTWDRVTDRVESHYQQLLTITAH